MRFMSILVFVAYVIASALPDALYFYLAEARRLHMVPYHVAEYLGYLDNVPWNALVFGISFGLTAAATAEPHNRPAKEEVIGFMLIAPLIFIILQYGLGFAVPMLSAMHIDPALFAKTISGFFLALTAWKGLHIPLGGLGLFLMTLLAMGLGLTGYLGIALPINPDLVRFTILGTCMGAVASFGRA